MIRDYSNQAARQTTYAAIPDNHYSIQWTPDVAPPPGAFELHQVFYYKCGHLCYFNVAYSRDPGASKCCACLVEDGAPMQQVCRICRRHSPQTPWEQHD